jgi:hypothetical protein
MLSRGIIPPGTVQSLYLCVALRNYPVTPD